MQPQFQPSIPQAPRFTRWHNPTDRDIVLDLYVGRDAGPTGRQRYIVPSKGNADIPSNLDRGIQHIHDGVVEQGFAPSLRRIGTISERGQLIEEPAPLIADALDPAKQKEAQERRAIEEMIKSQIAMNAAADALKAQANGQKQGESSPQQSRNDDRGRK